MTKPSKRGTSQPAPLPVFETNANHPALIGGPLTDFLCLSSSLNSGGEWGWTAQNDGVSLGFPLISCSNFSCPRAHLTHAELSRIFWSKKKAGGPERQAGKLPPTPPNRQTYAVPDELPFDTLWWKVAGPKRFGLGGFYRKPV